MPWTISNIGSVRRQEPGGLIPCILSPVLRLSLDHSSESLLGLLGFHIRMDICGHDLFPKKGFSLVARNMGKHKSHCDLPCSGQSL